MHEDATESFDAACSAKRLTLHSAENGHQVRDPGQRSATPSDSRGLLTEPDAGDWAWGLDLESSGFAEDDHEVTSPGYSQSGTR